jgi:hypothetical protein
VRLRNAFRLLGLACRPCTNYLVHPSGNVKINAI